MQTDGGHQIVASVTDSIIEGITDYPLPVQPSHRAPLVRNHLSSYGIQNDLGFCELKNA
jgi:hypothetical protein